MLLLNIVNTWEKFVTAIKKILAIICILVKDKDFSLI